MAYSQFRIQFDTVNDKFQPEPFPEVIRILKDVIHELSRDYVEGVLKDKNGNRIGEWSLDEEEK
jgi:hypothetical protein